MTEPFLNHAVNQNAPMALATSPPDTSPGHGRLTGAGARGSLDLAERGTTPCARESPDRSPRNHFGALPLGASQGSYTQSTAIHPRRVAAPVLQTPQGITDYHTANE